MYRWKIIYFNFFPDNFTTGLLPINTGYLGYLMQIDVSTILRGHIPLW